MRTNYLKICALFLVILYSCSKTTTDGPYLATGIKIGEVTQNEAIVWVRLTQTSERVGNDAPLPDIRYKDPKTGEMLERQGRPDITPVVNYPDGYNINNIHGAVPGSEGKVRLKYKVKDKQEWIQLDWQQVNPEQAFATQFELSGLTAGQEYELLVEASPLKGKKVSASIMENLKPHQKLMFPLM